MSTPNSISSSAQLDSMLVTVPHGPCKGGMDINSISHGETRQKHILGSQRPTLQTISSLLVPIVPVSVPSLVKWRSLTASSGSWLSPRECILRGEMDVEMVSEDGNGRYQVYFGFWLCDRKICWCCHRSICVRQKALDDYNTYSQELLKRMVWSGSCRSWYKNRKSDGPVTALYAGSRFQFRGMTIWFPECETTKPHVC